jgi:hypothetical protein
LLQRIPVAQPPRFLRTQPIRPAPCPDPAGYELGIAGPAVIRKPYFLFFLPVQGSLDFCLIRLARVLPHQAFRNLFGTIPIPLCKVSFDIFKVTVKRHFRFPF